MIKDKSCTTKASGSPTLLIRPWASMGVESGPAVRGCQPLPNTAWLCKIHSLASSPHCGDHKVTSHPTTAVQRKFPGAFHSPRYSWPTLDSSPNDWWDLLGKAKFYTRWLFLKRLAGSSRNRRIETTQTQRSVELGNIFHPCNLLLTTLPRDKHYHRPKLHQTVHRLQNFPCQQAPSSPSWPCPRYRNLHADGFCLP